MSYEPYTKKTLLSSNFLSDLLKFENNTINGETVELLEPYFNLKTKLEQTIYTPEVAAKTSAALSGILSWTIA